MDELFLSARPESLAALDASLATALQTLKAHYLRDDGVYSGQSPKAAAQALAALDPCPDEGLGTVAALNQAAPLVLGQSLRLFHPGSAAHLHCPPLIPTVAAETWIGATNPSLDSWDQAPVATMLELSLCRWLARTFGYGEQGDGVFTSGGTQGNFMGLLFARNRVGGPGLNQRGLPAEATRWRILCSPYTHFSVQKSLAQLGLGGDAAVVVAADAQRRLDPTATRTALRSLQGQGLLPIAIAATAGTTDYGSIDPLPALADLATEFGVWLHVDAAYAGALILSNRERARLTGIERADSITVDFHKLFFQPISCSAFLVRDTAHFGLIRYNADYLNPEDDDVDGFPNLVVKSVQTSRRFDALKLWLSLRAVGRRRYAGMVEHVLDLTQALAAELQRRPKFTCLNPHPALSTLLFQYDAGTLEPTHFHRQLAERLLLKGWVNLGVTRADGQAALKFTLLNPVASLADYIAILDQIESTAAEICA